MSAFTAVQEPLPFLRPPRCDAFNVHWGSPLIRVRANALTDYQRLLSVTRMDLSFQLQTAMRLKC